MLDKLKDKTISTDNIQEYIKDIKDCNNNTRLVNLFLYDNHYSLITNFNRLISKQLDKHRNEHYICLRCLQFFRAGLKYYDHLRFCVKNKASKAVLQLPKPDTLLSFKMYQAKQKYRLQFIMTLKHTFKIKSIYLWQLHITLVLTLNLMSYILLKQLQKVIIFLKH